jgi:hypothetical protein
MGRLQVGAFSIAAFDAHRLIVAAHKRPASMVGKTNPCDVMGQGCLRL